MRVDSLGVDVEENEERGGVFSCCLTCPRWTDY